MYLARPWEASAIPNLFPRSICSCGTRHLPVWEKERWECRQRDKHNSTSEDSTCPASCTLLPHVTQVSMCFLSHEVLLLPPGQNCPPSTSPARCRTEGGQGRLGGLCATTVFSRCPGRALPSLSHALNCFVPRKAQASPLQRALPGRPHLHKACLPFPKSTATETRPFRRNPSSTVVWRTRASALCGAGEGQVGHFPSPLSNCRFPSAAPAHVHTYPERAAERQGE